MTTAPESLQFAQNGPVIPVTYDGTMSWDQWLCLFEVAAKMNNWTSDSTKMASMLIFSLRGHPLSLCLTLDEASKNDYETLKAKLNEIMAPEETLDMLMCQLEQRKRRPLETLVDLKVDIHKLVCKVYPGMDADGLEKHARVAFLKSISGTSYGEKTIDAEPKTLEEALHKAQFFEQREQLWNPQSIGPSGQIGYPRFVGPSGQIGYPQSVGPSGQIGYPRFIGPSAQMGYPQYVGPSGQIGYPQYVGPSGQMGYPQPVGPNGQIGYPRFVGPTGQMGYSQSVGPTGQIGNPQFVGPSGHIGNPQSVGPSGQIGNPQSVGSSGQIGNSQSVGPSGQNGKS